MIKIRQATKRDSAVLALLGRVTYSESHSGYIENKEDLLTYCDETFSIAKIEQELADSQLLYYLIFVNDLPVGYAKLILGLVPENMLSIKNCKLDKIYILDDFIPLKLGQKLMSFIEKQVQSMQLDAIWLHVYIKNIRAIRFYEKNAFKEIGNYDFIVNEKSYENLVLAKTYN